VYQEYYYNNEVGIRLAFGGNENTSKIKFVSNPANGNVVTFDESVIYSDGDSVNTIFGTVFNDNTYASTPIIDISSSSREGLIRVRELREDVSPSPRLRGQYAEFSIDIGTERPTSISRVLTKYRTSKRAIVDGK